MKRLSLRSSVIFSAIRICVFFKESSLCFLSVQMQAHSRMKVMKGALNPDFFSLITQSCRCTICIFHSLILTAAELGTLRKACGSVLLSSMLKLNYFSLHLRVIFFITSLYSSHLSSHVLFQSHLLSCATFSCTLSIHSLVHQSILLASIWCVYQCGPLWNVQGHWHSSHTLPLLPTFVQMSVINLKRRESLYMLNTYSNIQRHKGSRQQTRCSVFNWKTSYSHNVWWQESLC